MPVSVYGLSYRIPDFAVKSIESITHNQEIDFTVVDSLSPASPELRNMLESYVDEGKIARLLKPNGNCKGYGLVEAFYMFPPDKSHDFFVFTDLDVVVPEGLNWLEKVTEAMRHHDLCGFSLDTVNYVPPNGGYSPIGFGCHLMGIKMDFFTTYFKRGSSFLDVELRAWANRPFQIPETLYHLGWDIWKVDTEYFADKVKGINYKDRPVDLEYVVYSVASSEKP